MILPQGLHSRIRMPVVRGPPPRELPAATLKIYSNQRQRAQLRAQPKHSSSLFLVCLPSLSCVSTSLTPTPTHQNHNFVFGMGITLLSCRFSYCGAPSEKRKDEEKDHPSIAPASWLRLFYFYCCCRVYFIFILLPQRQKQQ